MFSELQRHHEVYGIYRSGESQFANSYKLDLADENAVRLFYENNQSLSFDVIIHTASKMALAGNLDDLSVLVENTAMAKNVASLAKMFNVKWVVNFSSASVYPNIDGSYDENSIPDPSLNADCIYGLSKLNAEVILNKMLLSQNISVTHLRISNVYGNGMNSSRLIPVLEKELAEKGSLTLYGNGERLQNIIHIEKLAGYISFILKHPVYGVMNISEEAITVKEIAERIITKNGKENSGIILVPQGNRSRFLLDTTKLQQYLSNAGSEIIKQ